MGVYSSNRVSSIGNIQVEAATGYNDSVGIQLAMIEGFQNDLALFEGAIMDDFKQATMVNENAAEEEITLVQEGAIGDFLGKIKEFFIKLWEKIKGIFKSFMAKFDSVVMRDNKAFHDKYQKDVYNKDTSKMKAKFSKPKTKLDFLFDLGSNSAEKNKVCLNADAVASKVQELSEGFDRDEYIVNILKGCKPSVSISEVKEYKAEVHKHFFEDEEEVEGFESIKQQMGAILTAKPNPVEVVRKANDSLDKAIKGMIADIEKSRTAVIKLMPADSKKYNLSGIQKSFGVGKDGDSYKNKEKSDVNNYNSSRNGSQVQSIQKALSYIHTQATAIQSAVGEFTAVSLAETKFEVAQARRIFAAIVAHNPKAVKESALLVEAAQEAAEYEVYSAFEAY